MLRLTKDVIEWIRNYFKDNQNGKAVLGISGGKDSTIAAALCVAALGKDRVVGVTMPNGVQSDFEDSLRVINHLGIIHENVNISAPYAAMLNALGFADGDNIPSTISTNLPARLRMSALYAVAAIYPNSRVVNTSNYSERYIGYSTKYGDGAGDFSPLGKLTVREILMIGDDLGLPYDLVHKTPTDGMSGKSDEEKIGFTYEELDGYLLVYGHPVSQETRGKIEKLHASNLHKMKPMPMFEPNPWMQIGEQAE